MLSKINQMFQHREGERKTWLSFFQFLTSTHYSACCEIFAAFFHSILNWIKPTRCDVLKCESLTGGREDHKSGNSFHTFWVEFLRKISHRFRCIVDDDMKWMRPNFFLCHFRVIRPKYQTKNFFDGDETQQKKIKS